MRLAAFRVAGTLWIAKCKFHSSGKMFFSHNYGRRMRTTRWRRQQYVWPVQCCVGLGRMLIRVWVHRTHSCIQGSDKFQLHAAHAGTKPFCFIFGRFISPQTTKCLKRKIKVYLDFDSMHFLFFLWRKLKRIRDFWVRPMKKCKSSSQHKVVEFYFLCRRRWRMENFVFRSLRWWNRSICNFFVLASIECFSRHYLVPLPQRKIEHRPFRLCAKQCVVTLTGAKRIRTNLFE